MKIFSTFSGIGGFEIGIQNAYRSKNRGSQENPQGNWHEPQEGKDVGSAQRLSSPSPTDGINQRPLFVGYSEIDKYAISVYERQFRSGENDYQPKDEQLQTKSDKRGDNSNELQRATSSNRHGGNYGDITKINAEELPDFDCLVGGFPCQAFSIAGKRGGFLDTRGTLFFDLARILKAKKPRLFVFENVKGLLSHDAGNTFKTIIATIDELGYDCQWQVINSKNHGVPQNRERIIIVGHLRGTPRPQVFPIESNDIEDNERCIDATGINNPSRGYEARKDGLACSLRATEMGSKNFIADIRQLNNPTHSNDRVYDQDGISPTLNTMQGGNRQPFIAAQRGRGNPPKQTLEPQLEDKTNTITSVAKDNLVVDLPKIRRLTPIECERLQAFPETEVSAIIDVCIDHQKNSVNAELVNLKSQKLAGIAGSNDYKQSAPSAPQPTATSGQPTRKPAQQNVHIFLEDNRIKLYNHEKSLSYVSGATNTNSLALPIQEEDFVQLIVGTLQTAEKITQDGKAVSAPSDSPLTAQENGNNSGRTYGLEMMPPVKNAWNDLTTVKELLKSTTSPHLDTESLGSLLATLSYFVVSATNGYTESETPKSSTYRLHLVERAGWTKYGKDGELISDTQRYKMCGNAVTTNVIRDVFERIL